jgi:hypothetical protein
MPRKTDDNPAAIYRDSLSCGSYWAVHHSLETIVKLLGGADPWSYPCQRGLSQRINASLSLGEAGPDCAGRPEWCSR